MMCDVQVVYLAQSASHKYQKVNCEDPAGNFQPDGPSIAVPESLFDDDDMPPASRGGVMYMSGDNQKSLQGHHTAHSSSAKGKDEAFGALDESALDDDQPHECQQPKQQELVSMVS